MSGHNASFHVSSEEIADLIPAIEKVATLPQFLHRSLVGITFSEGGWHVELVSGSARNLMELTTLIYMELPPQEDVWAASVTAEEETPENSEEEVDGEEEEEVLPEISDGPVAEEVAEAAPNPRPKPLKKPSGSKVASKAVTVESD